MPACLSAGAPVRGDLADVPESTAAPHSTRLPEHGHRSSSGSGGGGDGQPHLESPQVMQVMHPSIRNTDCV